MPGQHAERGRRIEDYLKIDPEPDPQDQMNFRVFAASWQMAEKWKEVPGGLSGLLPLRLGVPLLRQGSRGGAFPLPGGYGLARHGLPFLQHLPRLPIARGGRSPLAREGGPRLPDLPGTGKLGAGLGREPRFPLPVFFHED